MTTLKEFCWGFTDFWGNFRPYGVPKLHFVKSEWEDWSDPHKISWPFLLWKILYLCFCIFAVLRSMIDPNPGFNYWFLFLTHWSVFLQLIYCILFLINMAKFYSARGKAHLDSNNCLDSCVWILFNIIGVIPHMVSLVYWAVIYNPKNPRHVAHKTMFNHGFTAIFTLIDTLVVAIPIRVTHLLYLEAFGGIYATFTYMYEVCGGTYPWESLGNHYIYAFLNWREKPGRTVGFLTAIGTIALPILYFVLWLLYVLRLGLVSKCGKVGAGVYERHRYGLVRQEEEETAMDDVEKS